MKFILGEKENMIQYYGDDGEVFPVTLVSAMPNVVTQIKKKETDGYESIQVGYGEQKKQRVNKAQLGHTKDLGNFKLFREFEMAKDSSPKIGDKIDVSIFKEGDIVDVTGISKGKGFQGVIKRHGFKGGPRSHGQKHSEREPGSIGGGLRTRIPKGMRMGGRMGSDTIVVRRLKVIYVDKENNQLAISGALPGRKGTLIKIQGK